MHKDGKNEKEKDQEIKVILIGESGTGKTSLINSVIGQQFIEGSQISSMMCSLVKLTLNIEGKDYEIDLWDTIGQEKFRSLTKIFLNDSKIVIFVFDITDLNSFNELEFWFDTIDKELGSDPIRAIAANKQDLENIKVNEDQIKEYANKKKVLCSYTSAYNGEAFKSFLIKLLKIYLEKNKNKKQGDSGGDDNKIKKLNKRTKSIKKKKKC